MTSAIKPTGWHSRRHQTRDAQDAAREQYKAERGRAARKARADERAARRASFVRGRAVTS